MKNVLIVVLAFFSLSAAAAVIGPDQVQNQGQAQGQIQGQAQGQGQAQFSNADSRARAQSYAAALNRTEVQNNVSITPAPQPVTVNYNEAAIPTNTRQEIHQDALNIRTVPNVFGGNVYPTAPCMGSSTAGAAALGWGFSVGSSWTDDECGIRETARSFSSMEMKADALAVLCSSKYAAVAPACQRAQPK